jgi:hypothetical protein
VEHEKSDLPKPIWAYAYELVPPQADDRLGPIVALLDQEAASAKLRAQTWEGRLVREKRVTHILVVSDSSDQGRDVNHRIERELAALQAAFSITAPMAVVDDAQLPPDDAPPEQDPILRLVPKQ